MPIPGLNRRQFLKVSAGSTLSIATLNNLMAQQTMMRRAIPSTGESIPVIGLGTSDEFERSTSDNLDDLKVVLNTLLDNGANMVDTAPTYGNSEEVLGKLFSEMKIQQELFIATKISLRRTLFNTRQAGIDQMIESARVMGKAPLDLIYVHNLNDLETQWQNLQEWKMAGKVRYIGVTISNYQNFDEMEAFLRKASGVDFMQINYSLIEPKADELLIPLARDKGAAIVTNRPFGNGGYFRRVRGKVLPEWAKEIDCESWAQFTLKWILGNPDITCAIPATSNARHMLDNARAGYGKLPDQKQRRRMLEIMQSI
jgi:aryl-alcohol dehydrogenase-like predicted oxidoreductase